MKLATYKDSAFFGFTQMANYRSEVWFSIAAKVLTILGLILLWTVISRSSAEPVGFLQLAPYFMIANAVSGLIDAESMRFTRIINDEVKSGTLSSHLLRPIHPVLFLYTSFLGTRGVIYVMSLLLLILGVILLPSLTWLGAVMFAGAMVMAWVISFSVNLLVGSLTFWTTEADHLQNVASHFIRVFSGVMIPISYFPGNLRIWTLLSPFPSLGYLPATLLSNPVFNQDLYMAVVAGIFWSVMLFIFSLEIWRLGLRHHEAVGI